MPRRVLERATARDDEAVRALLRVAPMEGAIRLTFEREPDCGISAAIEGDRHHSFVAREDDGRILGTCSRAVRRVWINGEQARVGYLGQLRSVLPAASVRRLIGEGFAACRETRQADELPFDYTSIMADNIAARRLLERGMPGLPRYVPIGEFRTFVLPARGAGMASRSGELRIEQGSFLGVEGIAAFLQAQYRNYQLAPVWTETDLRSEVASRDLSIDDFVLAILGETVIGCAALWDQRAFRQIVVRGYSPWLEKLRPLINGWYGLTGEPRLPAVGNGLSIGTISHFAVENDDPLVAMMLLDEVSRMATSRGLELLTLGLAEKRPLYGFLRTRLRARILESILYCVIYEGEEPAGLDGRVPHVEVAVL